MKKQLLTFALSVFTTLAVTQTAFAEPQTVFSGNGFVIGTEEVKGNDGFTYTNVYTSYYGKSAELLSETENLNIAVRTYYNGTWNGWTPLEAYTGETADRSASILNSFNNQGLQFCVTDQPFPTTKLTFDHELSEAGYHIAISEPVMLDVPLENQQYQAPPYIASVTPAVTSTFNLASNGRTAHITAIYDQPLKATGDISVTVETPGVDVSTATSNLKWENITHRDQPASRVEFDVTFDESYNSQFAAHNFYLNNLVGESSGKQPNKISYMTTFYDCSEVYGCDDNNGSAGSIIHMSQSRELGDGTIVLGEDFINLDYFGLESFDTNILLEAQNGSSSKIFVLKYNYINSVAKLNAGYQATLAVPYPQGFDGNSSFKAYKFMKGTDGNYVGQELATRISSQGLEVSHGTFGGALKTLAELTAPAENTTAAEDTAAADTTNENENPIVNETVNMDENTAANETTGTDENDAANGTTGTDENETVVENTGTAENEAAVENTGTAEDDTAVENTDTVEDDAADELVVFYVDANYKGASVSFGPGSYNIGQLGALGNDRLSSIRIPDGFTVTLYEHGNFKGRTVTCTEDVPFLKNSPYKFNDITSSIKITRN